MNERRARILKTVKQRESMLILSAKGGYNDASAIVSNLCILITVDYNGSLLYIATDYYFIQFNQIYKQIKNNLRSLLCVIFVLFNYRNYSNTTTCHTNFRSLSTLSYYWRLSYY